MTGDRPWAAFTYRDYRILWVVLLATSTGFWLRILGTAQWLLDRTDSPMMVGLIGVVQLVVQTPALLWGGTLADRMDRKLLIVLSNGISCAVLLALGVNHLMQRLRVRAAARQAASIRRGRHIREDRGGQPPSFQDSPGIFSIREGGAGVCADSTL